MCTNYEEYIWNLHVCGCIQLLHQQDLFLCKATSLLDYGLVIDVNHVVFHPDNPKIGVQLPYVDSDECHHLRPMSTPLHERMELGLEGTHPDEPEPNLDKGKGHEYVPPLVNPILQHLPTFNVGAQSVFTTS